jgi:hypothetical protein
MKKMILTTGLAVAATLTTNAQRYLGLTTSNWSGLSSVYLNPGNIADSRTKFDLDLSSFNLIIDNSLASVNLSNATSGGSDISKIFSFSNSAQFNVLATIEYRGPGIMYSIDDDNTVAISTRFRAFEQFNNFDQRLFQSLMSPGAGSDYSITSQNFNWTTHLWGEFNLSYARVLYKEKEHFIKAGITLGRASGLGYMSVKGSNLDATLDPANHSLVANHSDIEFATNVVNNSGQLTNGVSNLLGGIFGGSGEGGGGGFRGDIGAVYEYRPDHADWEADRYDASVNKYKVRGSIAITDIGAIKYKGSYQANVTGNGSVTDTSLAQSILAGQKFSNYMASRGFHLDTPRADTKVHLPTALVLGADYYVASHFYVNGTLITNLANRQNYGNSFYGQLSITPRWDTKIFTAAIPLTYSGMTHSIKAGLGLRLGGFFFGSDDMLLFLGGKAYGVNYYMGAFVPINKRHHKHKTEATTTTTTPPPPAGESK